MRVVDRIAGSFVSVPGVVELEREDEHQPAEDEPQDYPADHAALAFCSRAAR